jgi:hypothetical protein
MWFLPAVEWPWGGSFFEQAMLDYMEAYTLVHRKVSF